MDFDAFLKQLQTWTNSVPLVILGSGSSIPFGLPSMWRLGDYLKREISFADPNESKEFKEFVDIFDSTGDLERALSDLNLSENVLNSIVTKTWELVTADDLNAFNEIVVNRIEFPLHDLVRYLLSAASRKLTIITTNYDRLAEYAVSLSNGVICTGYNQNPIGFFSNEIHKNQFDKLSGFAGQVNIWKVHGSLDWFKNNEDKNVQLTMKESIPNEHQPLIVTPGLNKYFQTHLEPYRTIFTEADWEIDHARGYVCIGYGFNDLHVQPRLTEQIKSGKPIIVITKSLTDKTIQTIIDNQSPNYILIEEDATNPNNTRIFSSKFGEEVITDKSYWKLDEFLTLIK